MLDETPLDFRGVERWLRALVGRTIEVHIADERSTVGFVRGAIDQVMRFESDDSHGFSVDGGAGAWVLEFPAGEFVSASLHPVPVTFTSHKLVVRMRGHQLMIEPDGPVAMSPTG